MAKVVVIGGGASGIMASIVASKKHDVILVDGMDKLGKKILLTGNGRCNYWNSNININKYNTDDIYNLEQIINTSNQDTVLKFLESIGIYPKIKNGYYYPYSNLATSVREILIKELEKNKVKVITNFKVKDIKKIDESFFILSENETIKANIVVLATGSKTLPKTGSDGSGYLISSKLGHTINKVCPSLTSLISNSKYDWAGVRMDAKLELFINDKKVQEEIGEVQLTEKGISGICTFNISSKASKNLDDNVSVNINFFPYIETSFFDWLDERSKNLKNYTIEELLESIIPYKLMFVFLKKAGINKDSYWYDLTDNEKLRLCDVVTNFELKIVDTASFDKAQVCTGGISLKEIDPNTMESKLVDNLYITGELLDVDGICGGFNLAFAFITGYLAGMCL